MLFFSVSSDPTFQHCLCFFASVAAFLFATIPPYPLPWWVSHVKEQYDVRGVGGFVCGGGVGGGVGGVGSGGGGGGESVTSEINGDAIITCYICWLYIYLAGRWRQITSTAISQVTSKKETQKSASHLGHKISKKCQTCVWTVPSRKKGKKDKSTRTHPAIGTSGGIVSNRDFPLWCHVFKM